MRSKTFGGIASPEFGNHKLYTITEFAQIIAWHKESVRRAIRQERIFAIKVGRQWRIPESTVTDVVTHGILSTGGAR